MISVAVALDLYVTVVPLRVMLQGGRVQTSKIIAKFFKNSLPIGVSWFIYRQSAEYIILPNKPNPIIPNSEPIT
jgi:hypothetical protein